MNELISKQKAIDEIKEFQSQVTCDFSKDWLNGMDEGFAHSVNVIELIDTVDAIPIEWMKQKYPAAVNHDTTRYISKVDLLNEIIEEWRKEE